MKTTISIIALVAMTACAQAPATIEPTYVSPTNYAHLSCHDMNIEAQRMTTQLNTLIGSQQAAADSDATMTGISLLLFWPAAFFIAGGEDHAGEIATLRGSADALYAAAVAKGCGT